MVNFSGVFSRLNSFRCLVLGDFLLDTYTTGRVKRISPEAPVPVMEVEKQEMRLGGAGNVVLNLCALGGSCMAFGRIGDDEAGQNLRSLLEKDRIDTSALLIEPGYMTPVKNRLIADSQQLLRVDLEKITPLISSLEQTCIERLERCIPEVQIVALSDYGKGFLTNRLIQAALQIAKCHGIPTIVDPKGSDFTKYRGATMLKPNLMEAYAAAKAPVSSSLDEVANQILKNTCVELLLVTRSEAGISLFSANEERRDFAVLSKEVKDVTGAGDTVLATLCLGLANQLDIAMAIQLSNLAAGIAIERLGCVQVSLPDLIQRLLELDHEAKVFDACRIDVLCQVLKGRPYSLMILLKGQAITLDLFRTIRQLSEKKVLIVYMPKSCVQDELVQLLLSLSEVDYILLNEESVKNLCEAMSPQETYIFEERRFVEQNTARDLLSFLRGSIDNPAAKA